FYLAFTDCLGAQDEAADIDLLKGGGDDAPGLASVQALRQAEDGAERTHGPLLVRGERDQVGVSLAGEGATVVAGDRGNDGDLSLVEAKKVGIADKIIGVFLIIAVGEEGTDVMEQGGVLEKLALPGAQV